MPDSTALLKAPIFLSDLARPKGWQPHLAILIYHQVLVQRDPLRPGVILKDEFARQMALLRKFFSPISLKEGVKRLAEGTLTPRCVCVTFDDGYSDNLTVAAPLLEEYGIPATVFVAPGFLDGGAMWNDRVIEAVGQATESQLDGELFGLGVLPMETYERKQVTIRKLLAAIKHRPMKERDRLVNELEQILRPCREKSLMMTTEQLRELCRFGIDVGAHTCNHPILSCEDDQTARAEIIESKALLERVLQKPVDLFAYPNGRRGTDYEFRHVEMAEGAGFFAAVSTDNGLNREANSVMQLHRFTPWDKHSLKFGLRLLSNEFSLARS
jgi:peptidoglycan/xylan/chitin deacetylase (PgdA/CDA1 family)